MIAGSTSAPGPGWAPALALTIALTALLGCAGRATASDWPEPMPAYPAPPGGHESAPQDGPPPETRPSLASKPAPKAESSSPLASRYKSQKAQSTLLGKATYYGDSLSGHKTANGERYNPREFTAAHKKLPFGTVVRVIRVDSGKVTYVRVNDRGPFGARERIIDLSRAAAEELEMIRAGVVSVRVEIVGKPDSS